MKLKNVKIGQRVQYKGGISERIAKGEKGTIVGYSAISDSPRVAWDDREDLRTDIEGYEGQVWIVDYTELRKYKD